MEKIKKAADNFRRGCSFLPAFVIIAVLAVSLPVQAFAQCESASNAQTQMATLNLNLATYVNNFVRQERSFLTQDFAEALYEILSKLTEFDTNVVQGAPDSVLNAWYWRYRDLFLNMTRQLSVAYVDQTRVVGSLIDAQQLNEHILMREKKELEAHRRLEPSELSCQVDSAGAGQTKAFQMSRPLTRGFQEDARPTRGNTVGSPGALGIGTESAALWDEYKTKYCDKAKGDQGCATTPPGPYLGRHKDVPVLLWTDKLTIDPTPANREIVQTALRYLIHPFSPDPIIPAAVETVDGRAGILARRAEEARLNTIYNVMGQLVSERFGAFASAGAPPPEVTFKANIRDLRQKAGIQPADISDNPSYREIQEAMTRERYNDPAYIVSLTESPTQLPKEQQTINVLRLQQMRDIYRRSEEMLFMAAADAAHDLDKQMPSSATQSMPMK